jgi:hypothetical protein
MARTQFSSFICIRPHDNYTVKEQLFLRFFVGSSAADRKTYGEKP